MYNDMRIYSMSVAVNYGYDYYVDVYLLGKTDRIQPTDSRTRIFVPLPHPHLRP